MYGKYMRCSVPEGGIVMLQWPENISLDSLEMVEEIIAIQLKSVRRSIERMKAQQVSTPAKSGEKTL